MALRVRSTPTRLPTNIQITPVNCDGSVVKRSPDNFKNQDLNIDFGWPPSHAVKDLPWRTYQKKYMLKPGPLCDKAGLSEL